MAGFTLADIRAAIGAQLRANLAREINVDVDGEGKPAPVIRLDLDAPPDYWISFGDSGIASVRFRLGIDVGNTDQSAVRRLDEFLSVGTGNGSSVVDALLADDTLQDAGLMVEVAPGLYNAATIEADLILTVSVLKL